MVTGVHVEQKLCPAGVHPFDTCAWETCDVTVGGAGGKNVFEQHDCRFPAHFTDVSRQIVASKYFRGRQGTQEREWCVSQVISRVANQITSWGAKGRYFRTVEAEDAFNAELKYILLHQYACFNSPVLFNLGLRGAAQQGSACFILSAEDSLPGWNKVVAEETAIFKWGSGSGWNVSTIRSSYERITGGGWASGPKSLMRITDVNAGQIKSGGLTRRAAKMFVMDVTHPDLLVTRDGEPGFVPCKLDEERAAHALIRAGYDPGFNVPGGAYARVYFQNANHSVRAGDDFFSAVVNDRPWVLKDRFGEPVHTLTAREIHRAISEAAHACGDPAYQYDGAIQSWHTLPNSGRITASNPCSEFLHLDNTSCNLFSLRLTKFLTAEGAFDMRLFAHVCRIMTLAGEIIVGGADYPTETIATETKNTRPLGLGYCDLGALLMRMGLPYDSEFGREMAAAITSLMCATGYATSAEISRDCGGPFAYFAANREPMLGVIQKHERHNDGLVERGLAGTDANRIALYAATMWETASILGIRYGFRNAQATVIAPTGTIAFFLGADTTGIEPDIALVKFKSLAGGGSVTWINESVEPALDGLGYPVKSKTAIMNYLRRNGHLEGCLALQELHLPVFDCAFTAPGGARSISYMGHLLMMAAVQPFISGAISKTVNVPAHFTVEDVERLYLLGWQLGLKAVAIYRDGSKGSQPLEASKGDEEEFAPAQLTCPQCGQAQEHDTSAKCLTCANCGYQSGCSI